MSHTVADGVGKSLSINFMKEIRIFSWSFLQIVNNDSMTLLKKNLKNYKVYLREPLRYFYNEKYAKSSSQL